MSNVGQLSFSPRLLMGPGPSDVHPRILSVMALPVLGHLDPQFLVIMNETQELLRQALQTSNRLTFPISGTGMAGMETCMVNLLEPGDRAVVCVAGFFGERMAEVASRTGAEVTRLEQPWGQVFDPQRIRETLQKVRPKVLAIVQAETSTGAWQPLEELGTLCREVDALLVVDAVGSRYRIDHDYALRRMEQAGAILTTSETVAFECVGGAGHPAFKGISALLQERMKALAL